MPLFRRPDGTRCRDVAPVRAIMPYLMKGRNESAVYQEAVYDIGRARRWLKAYNRTHAQRATLFHLFVFACARALQERPGMNRFVSGGRLYEHKDVSISFAAKKEMSDEAPFVTVKLAFPRGEPFESAVRRIVSAVGEGREGPRRAVDREVALVMALPGFLVRFAVWLVRALDRWNLLPWFMMKNDPMYASLFLANLGSVGLADAYHHLYEYGTVSIFGVMSFPRRTPFVEGDGVAVREGLPVRWTFDERINDGFYAAGSLRIAQEIMEDPEMHLGRPEAAEGAAPRRAEAAATGP
jgi:hypothetical protein